MTKENNLKQIKKLRTVLKTIPNEFEGKDYTVKLLTDELTSLCPFTGIPDFYKIHIIYIPAKELIELKSLKFYLLKFRELRITHEALLNVIFDDLANSLNPKYIKIELHANIRGGIRTTAYREQGEYYYCEKEKQ